MAQGQRGFLSRFLARLWRAITMLRTGLANLLLLLVLGLLVILLLGEKPPPVPDRAALVLGSIGRVVEQTQLVSPVARLLGDNNVERETALQDVLDAIDYAVTDERIEIIVLPADGLLRAGLSKGRQIGIALQRFRDAGKMVIATADWMNQDQYLVASYADEIWLNPVGDLLLQGFAVYRNYFRDALDRLGIDIHVFRAGVVKDAAEPLVATTMSEESREANRVWLEDLWRNYTDTVSTQRELPPEAVDNYIDGMARIFAQYQGDGAVAARQYGLVDELKTRQQVRSALQEKLGSNGEHDYPAINFRDYLAAMRPLANPPADSAEVAVLVAQGLILPGDQRRGLIGSESLTRLLRQAREDEDVRAVVLRVDSPGGVMFAGEVIREALIEVQQAGKPVVVSMGSVAASGGYQIAAPADEIWAHETTLTGSIGVILQFPTVDRGLAKLGINNDGVATNDAAGGLAVARPLSADMRQRLELSVQNSYRQFLQLVADGREMTTEQVERAAEGRVWTGRQAMDLGLVDRLGGLNDAVASAAALAGLSDYQLRWLEEPADLQERILESLPMGLQALALQIPGVTELRSLLIGPEALLPGMRPGLVYSLCDACPSPKL